MIAFGSGNGDPDIFSTKIWDVRVPTPETAGHWPDGSLSRFTSSGRGSPSLIHLIQELLLIGFEVGLLGIAFHNNKGRERLTATTAGDHELAVTTDVLASRIFRGTETQLRRAQVWVACAAISWHMNVVPLFAPLGLHQSARRGRAPFYDLLSFLEIFFR